MKILNDKHRSVLACGTLLAKLQTHNLQHAYQGVKKSVSAVYHRGASKLISYFDLILYYANELW